VSALVFVYNAGSGLVNGALDLAHKLLSPHTYPCRLCALTYGTFGMKREWRAFVDALPHPAEFLHKDELRERYGLTTPLPAVLWREGERLTPWLGPEELNACETLQELQALIRARLSGAGRLTAPSGGERA
jgi:hypothetical protein